MSWSSLPSSPLDLSHDVLIAWTRSASTSAHGCKVTSVSSQYPDTVISVDSQYPITTSATTCLIARTRSASTSAHGCNITSVSSQYPDTVISRLSVSYYDFSHNVFDRADALGIHLHPRLQHHISKLSVS
jgi:TnpA family transposase